MFNLVELNDFFDKNFKDISNHPILKTIFSIGTDSFINRCEKCNVTAEFKIDNKVTEECIVEGTKEKPMSFGSTKNIFCFVQFHCVACNTHQFWVILERAYLDNSLILSKTYRILGFPNFLLENIPEELPQDPPELRLTYIEAVRCIEAKCPISAVTMLRRALQIITRNILGAKPGNLADELKSLKGSNNKLGIPLSKDFHEYSHIIKQVGNQGAHPDKDPDLINITMEDANDLHKIFSEIVYELFIEPAEINKVKEALVNRRKIMGLG